MIEILLGLLLPFITILSIVIAVRHGPFRNRWWRVLYTGPIGLAVGFVWGGLRARARNG